jgi:hypothetical protein
VIAEHIPVLIKFQPSRIFPFITSGSYGVSAVTYKLINCSVTHHNIANNHPVGKGIVANQSERYIVNYPGKSEWLSHGNRPCIYARLQNICRSQLSKEHPHVLFNKFGFYFLTYSITLSSVSVVYFAKWSLRCQVYDIKKPQCFPPNHVLYIKAITRRLTVLQYKTQRNILTADYSYSTVSRFSFNPREIIINNLTICILLIMTSLMILVLRS